MEASWVLKQPIRKNYEPSRIQDVNHVIKQSCRPRTEESVVIDATRIKVCLPSHAFQLNVRPANKRSNS